MLSFLHIPIHFRNCIKQYGWLEPNLSVLKIKLSSEAIDKLKPDLSPSHPVLLSLFRLLTISWRLTVSHIYFYGREEDDARQSESTSNYFNTLAVQAQRNLVGKATAVELICSNTYSVCYSCYDRPSDEREQGVPLSSFSSCFQHCCWLLNELVLSPQDLHVEQVRCSNRPCDVRTPPSVQ